MLTINWSSLIPELWAGRGGILLSAGKKEGEIQTYECSKHLLLRAIKNCGASPLKYK
jgi:hypothetical protein